MRFWAYNFNNIEVRAMKCLPTLKSALNFDRDSINKAFYYSNKSFLLRKKDNDIRVSGDFKSINAYKKR